MRYSTEKSVRYGSITLAILCLYTSNAFAALEVITSSEKKALNEIENQYDIDRLLISVNNKFSQHNKKVYDIEEIKELIQSEKVKYDELIIDLPKKILAKAELSSVYKEIENTVGLIDELEVKAKDNKKNLAKENAEILAEYEAINKKRAAKSQQLFKLKTDITNRLISDLSRSSSSYPVNIDGNVECSKYKSIADCLKESKGYIVSNTRNESPFLNDKSVLLSYDVVDASMNMRGELRYRVAMKFKPSYNNKIDDLLNEELGLKSAMITLVSNVPADWYVNGTKVGTGKELFHEIPLGKHGILASYKNKDKSSIENIEGNGLFNYTFSQYPASTTTKTASKPAKTPEKAKLVSKPQQAPSSERLGPEMPEAQPKRHIKAKYTLLSDQSGIPLKKLESNEPKADEGDGYEYFMGITPATPKQNFEFSNEPTEK